MAATPRSESDADASTNSSSLQFGTAEALEHVRKLTDVGAMTRLLHECIAYQRALDLELETLLSQRSDLDRQLCNLHKSADVLEIVKADSSYMLSNVSSTSALADQVSAKVRHLDLAQSRVQDTLLRVDAIVDRSNCLDGVHKSLLAEDFESAASYIQTFLQIDSKFKDSSASDQRDQLLSYKKQLEGIAKKRLSSAVDQRDHPTILRFIKLYKPLGLEEEGLQVYVSYLKKVISTRSRMEFEQLVELMEQSDNSSQEECDSRGSNILKKFMEYRKLAKLTSEINSYKSNLLSVGVEGPDPREIELYLEEILSLTQLGEDYTEYMVSKIKSLTSVNPELGPQATKAFRSGNFSKVSQETTGYYVILEGFFMVENVRKAIQIDEHVLDSLTTSMVDDVFYVLQSCCRRAISTSNISSVIAVLSSAVSLLGGEYSEALQQKIRETNLGAKLFSGGVGVHKTGTEIATALNNMDVSSEYALKLRHEIEEQCVEAFPAPADRERVKSCLSELNEMSSEYAENEVNDPWVQRLLHAVETNVAWLQPLMTTNNYDTFLHLVIDFIVKRLEVIMMQKRFSQLGGLQLDRDARTLVSHFSSMTQRTVRDKFSRLTQMATILNLEKVSEILDFWGENSGPMTWRLTPAEVRRVLGLRVDFRPEAIAALKL
ncbi:hypothetical protein DH2020_038795 [Rehmannia glutinosa]|uniref:Conserved oligomeric Golgi complex subunit 4 n=1 Tax=Rehmannia glutinosa TaxID=99300 RepID=A0ABR0UY08_REHGL